MAESNIFEIPHGMILLFDILKSFFCELVVAEVESGYFFAIFYEEGNDIIG
jgi:hypothetical protein